MSRTSRRVSAVVRRHRRGALLLLPLFLGLAACGGSSGGAGSATSGTTTAPMTGTVPVSATYPVTVSAANGPLTLASAPHRIVSLSPTATEMLYAIGAGTQVVAVDDNSSYPTSAPRTKLSAFQPNAEAVVGYQPDLVVLSNDANGLLAALKKLKVPALLLPAAQNLTGSYNQEMMLGTATGHLDGANKVVKDTQSRISAAVASVPAASGTPISVYHELDQTYYSAASSTFIGSIYTLFGLKNIADSAAGAASSGGYPKLSAEYVLTSGPGLIVLADSRCCGQSPARVSARPGFSALPAVKNHRVIAIDDDIASRWGPRVADFVEAVAKALGGK